MLCYLFLDFPILFMAYPDRPYPVASFPKEAEQERVIAPTSLAQCVAVSPSQTRPTSCTEDWAFATAKFTPPCDLKVAIPPLFCLRSSSLGFLNGLFRYAHNPKNLTRADCYAPPVFHTWGTRVGLRPHSWFCFAKLLRSVGRGFADLPPI